MPSLEPYFHAAQLDIVVPVGGVAPPPSDARERAAWWAGVTAQPGRDTVFLDEKVSYAVSLRLPTNALPTNALPTNALPTNALPTSSPNPSPPGTPPELSALTKHLHMTATVSFLPPLGPPVGFERRGSLAPPPPVGKDTTPPPVGKDTTPKGSPTKQRPSPISPPRLATPQAAAGTHAGLTLNLPNIPLPHTPHTPHAIPPTPTSAAHQPSRPPVTESGVGGPPLTPRPVPAMSPGAEEYADLEGVTVWEGEVAVDGSRPTLVHTDEGWVAVWVGEMNVVYVRTQIANPVLGITASATLRAKPRKVVSDTASIRSVATTASVQTEDVGVDDGDDDEEEHIDLAHMEEVDLLGGLAATPVPSSRLGPTLMEDMSISIPPSRTPRPQSIPSAAPIQLSVSAGTTMRKSFRRVLGLSPGLRVRMRTLFLPQLLPPGAAADESEDSVERKIVVCVEIENGADSSEYAFEVEQVAVEVGGKGAKATAELVCQPGTTVRKPSSSSPPRTPAPDTVFPLQLAAHEQYNLLYAVTIASSPGSTEVARHKGEENRVVAIVLTGRPYRLESGAKTFPTAPFHSRWNCNLDLGPFYSTLPPAPPPPPAPKQNRPTLKVAAPTLNAIAGDRRYALANLLPDDRRVVTNPGRPNGHHPSQVVSGRVMSGRYAGDGHGLLVSVRLLPGEEGGIVPAPLTPDTTGTIYALDTFSIEVFVHNRTDTVRRFRLAVPAREADTRIRDLWSVRRRRRADEATYGVDDAVLGAMLAQYEAAAPALVALETDVRCGPLLPGASLAARIRFLALRDGVHRIERLRLTGMEGDFDFDISPVLEVVVAAR
ncbi:hypothetical protein CcaverHIS002_0311870 [Cutaneotrichosporon cavernicola]|uniref:Trafficking protein particle complex II-specific subunit 65 IgD3 domain-containing protein n=1 Tax=Cutaneotrichosporon cavernicola TaxID=279322 RepID=A0AA48L361_9TREE|nr:uncharacterized protein CcaverHIS019_0311740 [Cutaneotrichosporon cavernicola]BEI83319.1 hypothetical protein CcaverHIS002_0311870 [Cutaneotrichosporon cavernicola]BEI91104.1 hypothetical protein CcaverHIS019_0311740 [Cutaneotrichosporon cavernicola]BEI98881.1 hypothetical protein CcaverHIS631_0311800 [Cutaneotrichosporon cavernicola]BEJ06654.1 hypothetical protein CcaverHIS641_0311760 [Cutaneotrichosporon cavernicola]